MALAAGTGKVLRDALAYSGESFETSLGRSVRRHGGDYSDYVEIISKVREAARSRGVSLRDAARDLAD